MSSASDQTAVRELPGGADVLVGRREEFEHLLKVIERPGLVQVVGAPGIGVSRLLESVVDDLPESRLATTGVVDSNPAADAADLLEKMRGELEETGGEHLDRAGFSELLEAAAPAVLPFDLPYASASSAAFFEELAERAPSATIVVASQRRQRFVQTAGTVRLVGLEPSAGVELLRRRIAVSPQSVSDFGTASELRELVECLDGHPLALEAAADRCEVMSATELRERWRSDESWLFGTPDYGPRRRLHRCLEESWSHLTGAEQRLLRGLSLVPNAFGSDVLEPLGEAAGFERPPLEILERLVRHSWVVREPSSGSPRFRVPAVLRHFAARRRGEHSEGSTRVRRELASFADHRLAELIERLESGPANDALEAFRAREEFFVETARAVRESEPQRALELLLRVLRFHPVCSQLAEVRESLRHLVDGGAAALSAADRMRGHAGLAELYQRADAPDRARRFASRALEIASKHDVEARLRARALTVASLPLVKTDLEAAVDRLREASDCVEGAIRLHVRIHVRLGFALLRQFELQEARDQFEHARELLSGRSDPVLRAELSTGLGYVAFRLDRVHSSVASFEEALAQERKLGEPRRIAEAQFNLGAVLHDAGQRSRARTAFERARESWTEADATEMLVLPLVRTGALLGESGEFERARSLLRRGIRLADRFADAHNRSTAEAILALLALADADERCPAGVFRDALRELVVWRAPARAAVLRVALDLRRMLESPPGDLSPDCRVTLQGLRSLVSPEDRRLRRIIDALEAVRLEFGRRIAPEAIPASWRERAGEREAEPKEGEAREALADPAEVSSAFARLFVLSLDARLDDGKGVRDFGPPAEEAEHRLRIHPDALWFEVDGGARVDLTARKPLRRVLSAIVEDSADAEGTGLSVDDLIEVGWPEQSPTRDAGANRVYNVIRMLREKGLADIVVTGDSGYAIAPEVRVRVVHERRGV